MKYLKITCILVIISIFTFACSSDNDNEKDKANDDLAMQQNETENRDIPTSELTSGIVIEGATVKTGTPPSPNGSLDFKIETNNQEAFQDSGFNIEFASSNDIAGAYILFQDVDGNKSTSYFDVPVSELLGRASQIKTANSKPTKKHAFNSKTFMDNEFVLDVDFNNIQPGNFCYEICLYDSNNNISVIQLICVTVEAWGGNSSIVGNWIFDREVNDFDEGENEEEDISCSNGQSFSAFYTIYEKDEWEFVLEANGDYYEVYEEIYKELNFESSFNACSAIYGDTIEENTKYTGKWAYNEEDETLTVIDFTYEDLNDSSFNEVYENGDLYFEGVTAKVISNELVLTETYTEEGETITSKYYFKRK